MDRITVSMLENIRHNLEDAMGLCEAEDMERLQRAVKADPNDQAARDALSRELLRRGVGPGVRVGETYEHGNLRIHRWRDSIEVWNVTNAGKRGKKVPSFHADLWAVRDQEKKDALARALRNAGTYAQALTMVHAHKVLTPGIRLHERELRGVDVTPAGFEKIEITTPEFSLTADYGDFHIRDRRDQYNLPVCIPATKGGKRSIPKFYKWVKANESKIRKMTFNELTRAMSKAKIQYHQYCSMD